MASLGCRCVLRASSGKEASGGAHRPRRATTLLREAEDEFFSFQKRASLSIQRNKVSYFKRREAAGK